jgi:hypothetical protein
MLITLPWLSAKAIASSLLPKSRVTLDKGSPLKEQTLIKIILALKKLKQLQLLQ